MDQNLDTPQVESASQTIDSEAPTGLDLNEASSKILALTQPEPNSETADAATKELDAPERLDNAPKPTLSEAEQKAGELRQADYTRKTQAVAEQAKAIEGERQRIQQERGQYAQQLQGLLFVLAQEKPPNWDELIGNDPTEYVRQKHIWDQKVGAYQQAQQQLGQISSLQQQEQEQQLVSYATQQRDELFKAIPEWKDEKTRSGEQKAIRDSLMKYGFTSQELDNVFDSRAVIAARKVMLYDRMQANINQAKTAANKAPPVRVLSAGVPTDGNSINQAAFSRLKKSGRMDDATRAIQSLLG